MTFLPIVDRELRVASRRNGTYRTRLAVALAASVISGFLLYFYAANPGITRQLLGQYLFRALSGLALAYSLFAGRLWTADCLSEERRQGTLGLLFLTDLRGYDVVFGKVVATSLNGFYGLLSVFPVLALPLLMGGVTNGEFWRMVLVLVSTFLFSLGTGIFASALCSDFRQSSGLNLLLLLLLATGVPACACLRAFFSSSPQWISGLLCPCPAFAFYVSLDATYPLQRGYFWWSIAAIQAMTWLQVTLAAWVVPWAWREGPSTSAAAGWRERWQRWHYGDVQARTAYRKRLLQVNAFYWLAARVRFKPAGVWLIIGIIAGWWLFMCLRLRFNWFDESLSLTTTIMLSSMLKVWVAMEAGQRLAEDRKIGALELLLSTPLRVRDILLGQILALRRQFLIPLLLSITVVWLLLGIEAPRGFDDRTRIHAFGIAWVVMLVSDIAALTSVAMATALTVNNPNRASVSTIFRVLLLPWLLFAAISILVGAGTAMANWKFLLHLWFWLGISTDLVFGLMAWHQLRTRFRLLALERLPSHEPTH